MTFFFFSIFKQIEGQEQNHQHWLKVNMSLGEMIIQIQMKSYDLNKKLHWQNII